MVSQREKLEDIDNYANTIEELKSNSKSHISTLTELARDYGKNRQAGEVIKIIEKRIMHKVSLAVCSGLRIRNSPFVFESTLKL